MIVEQQMDMKSRKWYQKHPLWWRLVLGLVIFVAIFIILISALFVFVNTPIGKNYIAATIKAYTYDDIEIQGITGFFPNHLRVAEIQFKNKDVGVWLDIKQVQLNWSPFSLLQRKLSIQSFIAKEVNLEAFPPKKEQEKMNQERSQVKKMPFEVDIQHLQIDQFFISDKVLQSNINIAVDGQVKIYNLEQMMNMDTLKSAFIVKPKFRLFDTDRPVDFQFGGKVSGSIEHTDGTKESVSLIPFHFSILLPHPDQNNGKLHIYFGLGDKI